jgi:hypothetical protein
VSDLSERSELGLVLPDPYDGIITGTDTDGAPTTTTTTTHMSPPPPSHTTSYKADVFRYCVMLREGGLYMDNDFALLVHPEPFLMDAACGGVYLLAEYCENYGNMVRLWTGIMISGKGMPVWQCMLDAVKVIAAHPGLRAVNSRLPVAPVASSRYL